jgi:hypothetical protein
MMRLGNYKHRASHRIEHRLWSAISCHLRSQIEKKSHLGVLPGPEKHDHRTRRKAIDRMTHFFYWGFVGSEESAIEIGYCAGRLIAWVSSMKSTIFCCKNFDGRHVCQLRQIRTLDFTALFPLLIAGIG